GGGAGLPLPARLGGALLDLEVVGGIDLLALDPSEQGAPDLVVGAGRAGHRGTAGTLGEPRHALTGAAPSPPGRGGPSGGAGAPALGGRPQGAARPGPPPPWRTGRQPPTARSRPPPPRACRSAARAGRWG